MDDACPVALDFVREHHPGAKVAFLGGSAATGACFVETRRHRGWLVEAFVYSPDRAQQWMEKGRRARRPVTTSALQRMLLSG